MLKFSQLIDVFHERLCKLVSWFTLLMALLTVLIVVLRYGFAVGSIAMQESVMYLHGAVFLLGAAHTLRANEHVRVDVFYRNFSIKKKAMVDVFGGLLLLLPVNIFLMIISFDYVADSWALLEQSKEPGGLPLVFVLKSLIWLFALSMVLQGLADVIRNGLVAKSEVAR